MCHNPATDRRGGWPVTTHATGVCVPAPPRGRCPGLPPNAGKGWVVSADTARSFTQVMASEHGNFQFLADVYLH